MCVLAQSFATHTTAGALPFSRSSREGGPFRAYSRPRTPPCPSKSGGQGQGTQWSKTKDERIGSWPAAPDGRDRRIILASCIDCYVSTRYYVYISISSLTTDSFN